MTDTDNPVIIALGDSAMWTTGTKYEKKTPNLVHKALKNGKPIPPAHFRARGGAVIGARPPYKKTGMGGTREYYEPGHGYYHFKKDDADWYSFYTPNDWNDINQLKWVVGRDIGSSYPTHLQQIEQFPSRAELSENPSQQERNQWSVDVPDRDVKQLPENEQRGNRPKNIPPHAEDVDLLLINGGTNDIVLHWMMDYRKKTRGELLSAIRKHCYEDVRTMLEMARNRFPNAVIMVVGYFPFLSDWTNYKQAREFLIRLLGLTGTVAPIERSIDHAMTFARAHVHAMRKAVSGQMGDDVKNEAPGTVFVPRKFGTVNAFASTATDPWCWGQYDDDIYPWRKDACQHLQPSNDRVSPEEAKDTPEERKRWVTCVSAAIGHPNHTGSEQSAKSIINRWDRYIELSTRTTITELAKRGPPFSVRDELSRHNIGTFSDVGSNDLISLRYALMNRSVDSIKVSLRRSDNLNENLEGVGRHPYLLDKAKIYLEVTPGRPGTGENFRIDWEDGDGLRDKDTPQFDKHSEMETEVFVDPMHKRNMEGDVGAHDEGVVEGDNDPDRSYSTATAWDDRPLHLGEVQEMRLVIENPSRWALEEITVTMNGDISHTKSVNQVPNVDRFMTDNILDNNYTSPPPKMMEQRTETSPTATPEEPEKTASTTPGFGAGAALTAVTGSAILLKWLLDEDEA